jgi:hypothetical protein
MTPFIRIFALAWLALAAVSAHADPRVELAQARHDLDVSEQVLARITDRVRIARADPGTSDEQRLRLDEYLAHVRDLVAANRDRVSVLAAQVAALPAGTPGAAASGAARTEAEEVAALDAKLGESLSTFDQLLLDEARKARIRERREGGAGANGGGTGGGGGAGGARGSRGAKGETDAHGTRGANGEPGPGGTSDAGTDSPQGPVATDGSPGGRVGGDRAGTPGGGATTPPDVGNGNDDDIVARQIRRAAESEPDPELRKKLWDEYRKYKQGAATKG